MSRRPRAWWFTPAGVAARRRARRANAAARAAGCGCGAPATIVIHHPDPSPVRRETWTCPEHADVCGWRAPPAPGTPPQPLWAHTEPCPHAGSVAWPPGSLTPARWSCGHRHHAGPVTG